MAIRDVGHTNMLNAGILLLGKAQNVTKIKEFQNNILGKAQHVIKFQNKKVSFLNLYASNPSTERLRI